MEKKFVLWGHDLKEYMAMFDLSDDDLGQGVIEYEAGPTSFNAEMHALGREVKSFDGLFSLPTDEIKKHVEAVFESAEAQIKNNEQAFNLKSYGSLKDLIAARHVGIERFFADFEQGKKEERYLSTALENITYKAHLALVSHHLFVNYGDKGIEEHLAKIESLLNLVNEVRIFPLIDKFGKTSELLGPVLLSLQQQGYGSEVRQVASAIQPTGNAMLRVWAPQCTIK